MISAVARALLALTCPIVSFAAERHVVTTNRNKPQNFAQSRTKASKPMLMNRGSRMNTEQSFSVSASLALLLCLVGAGPCFAQQERGKALPRVWVLATGGTIAGTGASSTDLSNYRSGTVLGEDLVRAVPEIRKHADVRVEQIVNIASYDMTLDNWMTLAKRINQIVTDDPTVAGIVVTHGTSTLEETAYFLNLTVRHDRPVVLVGSMRPATAISADGPLNLLNAIRTASSPEARGKGVLVVMNDEINAAREVTKTNTLRVETFRAPDLGLLGYVDDDKVTFYRASTRRHTVNAEFDVTQIRQLPKVEIVYSSQASSTDGHSCAYCQRLPGHRIRWHRPR